MSRRAWLAVVCGAVVSFVLGFWLNPLVAAVLGVVSMVAFAAISDALRVRK